jgi:UDP-N-acetyl-D-glucosamine dehydrogenase
VQDALNGRSVAVNGARVLVLGVAYKKNVNDLRESPALEIIRLLQQKGARVSYHDPFCAEIRDDGHTAITGLPMRSVQLTPDAIASADLVLVVTDHSTVDYRLVADNARLIVDTRGVMRERRSSARVHGLSGAYQEPYRWGKGGPVSA